MVCLQVTARRHVAFAIAAGATGSVAPAFWDALIVVAAGRGGAERIVSEDLQPGTDAENEIVLGLPRDEEDPCRRHESID